MPLFGAYLKHSRTEKGLTLRKIAEAIGVDPSYLSRLERGEISSPSDELLERLPAVLERPKSEVYLAAARLTPELAGVLEQGIPYTIQQATPLLTLLEENLGGLFTQLQGKPLSELMTPTDEKTMSHINAAMAHVAELVQAMEDGRINQQQFEYVTETIRQLKLAVLAATTDSEMP